MKLKVVGAVVISILGCVCLNAAQTNLENVVTRAVVSQTQSHKVKLSFSWEKKKTVYDYVHRNRRRNQNVVVSVERETTYCQGTLLTGGTKVITVSDCAENGSWELKKITFTLANGKTGNLASGQLKKSDEFVSFLIDSSLSNGLQGVNITNIPRAQSLEDTFGSKVQNILYSWFIKHNIFSIRTPHSGRVTMEKGQPFFLNGKVVALVNKVPRYMPRSGIISEGFLTLFRIGNH